MSEATTTHSTDRQELSILAINLLKKVLYRDDDGALWQTLLDQQAQLRDYFAVLDLELILGPLRDAADGRFLLPSQALFLTLLARRREGVPSAHLAYLFHASLAALICAGCEEGRRRTGLDAVALSGGVFQNLLLLRLTEQALRAAGFDVLTHSLVPPNDGGISLGQAVAAMYALGEENA